MTLTQMIFGSGFFVQLVLLSLIVASIVSWTVALKKRKELRLLEQLNKNFAIFYKENKKLSEIFIQTKKYEVKSNAYIFQKGHEEFLRVHELKNLPNENFSFQDYFQKSGIETVKRSLNVAMNEIQENLENHLTVLATIGAICPFIGLFGTVWGIINSFMGISDGGTTLDAVAPGVAEALVTTAVGLVAAIPAVIFYNYFQNKVSQIRVSMESFSQEFLNMIDRLWPTLK